MPLTLAKRMFVYFMVIAFLGAPWVQVFGQGSTHGCYTSIGVTSGDMSLHNTGPGDMSLYKVDDCKEMQADTVMSCLAPSTLMMLAFPLPFEDWTQVHQPTVKVSLDGRVLEPEFSPPVELI